MKIQEARKLSDAKAIAHEMYEQYNKEVTVAVFSKCYGDRGGFKGFHIVPDPSSDTFYDFKFPFLLESYSFKLPAETE
ncbi:MULTISPECIES: hypothetical protein [Priestia]|uniref:Uncharacterized protein n=1 Tax=Priestia megaterium (strain WSH-002) TaxID=1006007 RepID=A0A8D3X4B6_PRIMW|nr:MULTISPECIES: hypothetical protein [Priestia]AEN92146.1 hypothetical protein BMWSH_p302 [Priestia megaterium WSH-002]MED4014162.1 hypothetical protein [Priestia aryabhattai]